MSSTQQVLAARPGAFNRLWRPSWHRHVHGSEFAWAIAFAIPYAAVFVGFVVYPIAYGLWMASDPSLYGDLIANPLYARTVINTALYVGLGVNVMMFLALLLSGFFMRRRCAAAAAARALRALGSGSAVVRVEHGDHAHEVEVDAAASSILVDGARAADLSAMLGIVAEIACERRARAAQAKRAEEPPSDFLVEPDAPAPGRRRARPGVLRRPRCCG